MNKYSVVLNTGGIVFVEADYFEIDEYALLFCNEEDVTLVAFNKSVWVSVKDEGTK